MGRTPQCRLSLKSFSQKGLITKQFFRSSSDISPPALPTYPLKPRMIRHRTKEVQRLVLGLHRMVQGCKTLEVAAVERQLRPKL